MIKVLLADDQELIRQSLSFVMSKQEDIEMVVQPPMAVKRWNSWRKSSPTSVLLGHSDARDGRRGV